MSAHSSLFAILKGSFQTPNPTIDFPVDNPVKEGEAVIGEVPIELRSIWAAAHAMRQELSTIVQRVSGHGPNGLSIEQMESLTGDMMTLKNRCQFLQRIFWESIQSIHDTKSPIGLRNGWKIVSFPRKEDAETPSDMLATLLAALSHSGIRVVPIRISDES